MMSRSSSIYKSDKKKYWSSPGRKTSLPGIQTAKWISTGSHGVYYSHVRNSDQIQMGQKDKIVATITGRVTWQAGKWSSSGRTKYHIMSSNNYWIRWGHGCAYMYDEMLVSSSHCAFFPWSISWRWPSWPCPAASAYRLRGTGSPETFPARLERMISTRSGSTENKIYI